MFKDQKSQSKSAKSAKLAIEKELKAVKRQEAALHHAAVTSKVPEWKLSLMDKIPQKVSENLEKAFCKAFAAVFEKGSNMIEKTYHPDTIRKDFAIREFAFQVRSDRKSLKKIQGDAKAANRRNLAITSVEGIGLGAFGIGLPDLVVFVGVLLKGIYEVALRYGFDYDSQKEQYFILKLMETSILKGKEWEDANAVIDRWISGETAVSFRKEEVNEQLNRTAGVFAADMLLFKFIQGLPVAGVIGGAGNPFYYKKVLTYAELKYRKRYLSGLLQKEISGQSI